MSISWSVFLALTYSLQPFASEPESFVFKGKSYSCAPCQNAFDTWNEGKSSDSKKALEGCIELEEEVAQEQCRSASVVKTSPTPAPNQVATIASFEQICQDLKSGNTSCERLITCQNSFAGRYKRDYNKLKSKLDLPNPSETKERNRLPWYWDARKYNDCDDVKNWCSIAYAAYFRNGQLPGISGSCESWLKSKYLDFFESRIPINYLRKTGDSQYLPSVGE